MFRAFGLNPPMEGRPRGTLTICRDEDPSTFGDWVAIFDHGGQRWEGHFVHMSMMDRSGVVAQLGEEERDLGGVVVVAFFNDMAAGGEVSSFEVYNRLPVSAEQVSTATVRVSAAPRVEGR